MERFEYLATLFSVVAGLSLTRALSGFARIVDPENEIRLSGVHIAWTLNIILWLVGFWWFTFMLTSVQNWNVSLLLFLLSYGATIYFLVALLYPQDRGAPVDFLERFIARRRSFFTTYVLLGFVDIGDTLIKTELYEMPGPPSDAYWAIMFFWIALGTVAGFTANKTFHRIFAYGWFAVISIWIVTGFVS